MPKGLRRIQGGGDFHFITCGEDRRVTPQPTLCGERKNKTALSAKDGAPSVSYVRQCLMSIEKKAGPPVLNNAGRDRQGYASVVANDSTISDFANVLHDAGYNNKTGTWTDDVINQLKWVDKWMKICDIKL